MSPQGGGAMIGDNDVWDRDGWQITPKHAAMCVEAGCDVCDPTTNLGHRPAAVRMGGCGTT